jgi:hypothetical protein
VFAAPPFLVVRAARNRKSKPLLPLSDDAARRNAVRARTGPAYVSIGAMVSVRSRTSGGRRPQHGHFERTR